MLGATLGALVSFQIARWLGRDFLSRFFKGHILSRERCSDRFLTKVVLLGRLVPVVPFDLVSYAAGLTRMSTWKFAAANLVGMPAGRQRRDGDPKAAPSWRRARSLRQSALSPHKPEVRLNFRVLRSSLLRETKA